MNFVFSYFLITEGSLHIPSLSWHDKKKHPTLTGTAPSPCNRSKFVALHLHLVISQLSEKIINKKFIHILLMTQMCSMALIKGHLLKSKVTRTV